MRNIEIFLQATPFQLDTAITAMQFLKELKEQETNLNLGVTFFHSFTNLTKAKFIKTPKQIQEYLLQDYSGEGLSVEEELKEGSFSIPIARNKKRHSMPVERIVFGIYEAGENVDDEDVDMEELDMAYYMSCRVCACIKVPTYYDSVSPELRDLLVEQREIPNAGGFEFDNVDSLKINLLLQLFALKVLYKRYLTIRKGKVFYRNIYVGNLEKTQYSLEYLSEEDDEDNKIDIDKEYKAVFDRAIMVSALTYAVFGQSKYDEVRRCITDMYRSALYSETSEIKALYQKAERERAQQQYLRYRDGKNKELIYLMYGVFDIIEAGIPDVENDESESVSPEDNIGEKDSKVVEDNKDFVISPGLKKYRNDIIHGYCRAMDFAKSYDCQPDLWHYVLTNVTKFYLEQGLYKEVLPMIRPWIEMNKRHLDMGTNHNYYCYFVALSVTSELGMMDDFVKYANKYIQYCTQDSQRESWRLCIDAALMLTGYYIRIKDYNRGLDSVKIALDAYHKLEEQEGEDKAKKANVFSLYAHIQMVRGSQDMAKVLYNKVLEYYYEINEGDTREMAVAYNNLGNCYSDMGHFEKAAEYQVKSAEMVKKLFGEEDQSLYIIYLNIAASYQMLGMDDEAQSYKDLAEEIRVKNNLEELR